MTIELIRTTIARIDESDADGWALHIELFGLVINITVAR